MKHVGYVALGLASMVLVPTAIVVLVMNITTVAAVVASAIVAVGIIALSHYIGQVVWARF